MGKPGQPHITDQGIVKRRQTVLRQRGHVDNRHRCHRLYGWGAGVAAAPRRLESARRADCGDSCSSSGLRAADVARVDRIN